MPRTLPTVATLVLTTLAALTCGCASSDSVQQERRPGVIYATGDSNLEVANVGREAPRARPRRQANFVDVLTVATNLACTYPQGATEVERRAFISRALDEREVDAASFDTELQSAANGLAFAEALATKMADQCPEALSQIIGE